MKTCFAILALVAAVSAISVTTANTSTRSNCLAFFQTGRKCPGSKAATFEQSHSTTIKCNRPGCQRACCQQQCKNVKCDTFSKNGVVQENIPEKGNENVNPFSWKTCCRNPILCRHTMEEADITALDKKLDDVFDLRNERGAQFLRMAFHEAGTFSLSEKVGGVNGCLLNHPNTQMEGEHGGLAKDALKNIPSKDEGDAGGPIEDLKKVLNDINAVRSLCMSAADINQYAGLWAVHKLANSTIKTTMSDAKDAFRWGRQDLSVSDCKKRWTDNLPGFKPKKSEDFQKRMTAVGVEMKKKMMDGNGFTLAETVALVGGAHSIGKIRSQRQFHRFTGPWVIGGDTDGGVFGNGFFTVGKNVSTATNRGTESPGGRGKFFPTDFKQTRWFGSLNNHISWLDTDVCLVAPASTGNAGKYPDYHSFSQQFADSETLFANSFVEAYNKMVNLGATFHPVTEIK